MKIHIIYWNYYLPDGSSMSIGGIQTYLTNLVELLIGLGHTVKIFQRSDVEFEKKLSDKLTVHGFMRDKRKVKGTTQYLFTRASKYIDFDNDLLVFGCESMIVPAKGIKTIAIQHGISWDVPEEGISHYKYVYRFAKKQLDALRTIIRIKKVDYLVCVDCNFINWYRAMVPCPQVSLHYIPNFSALPTTFLKKPDVQEGINIIFARRFEQKRGTRLFADVISSIIDKYPFVRVTVAGEGSDYAYLHNKFENTPAVTITKYSSCNSLAMHEKHHIAVIPTLGSEGTSLSLLEAMAAGCAVICTNVGGMTNIVIDNLNGRLINPSFDALLEAIIDLIEHPEKITAYGELAYNTIRTSFSLDSWRTKWENIVHEITE